jgi:hypothetical protein
MVLWCQSLGRGSYFKLHDLYVGKVITIAAQPLPDPHCCHCVLWCLPSNVQVCRHCEAPLGAVRRSGCELGPLLVNF